MRRYHPVSLQIADYLAFVAEDLRSRVPTTRLLATELDGLIDKMSFYANVCHSLTDAPLPAREIPTRASPAPQCAPHTNLDSQLRSDVEEIARAIRVAELSQPVVTAFARLVARLTASTKTANSN